MFDIDDPEYKALFDKEMENAGSFAKGPYLDVVDSFESVHQLKVLLKKACSIKILKG